MTKIFSPVVTFDYCFFNKPATNLEPTGMYESTCLLDPSLPGAKEFVQTVRAAWEAAVAANPKLKPAAPPLSKDAETGWVKFKVKTRAMVPDSNNKGQTVPNKPGVWDPFNKPWDMSKIICKGSEGIVNIMLAPYTSKGTIGLTLRLYHVQVLKHVGPEDKGAPFVPAADDERVDLAAGSPFGGTPAAKPAAPAASDMSAWDFA
ncbi:hypothetical protein [Rhizobacter sp. Root404]|uniref:hypothetical protein n=1 Tax=Rhizobacter sp. Root404 TaxID=1736528 RepID=UPI000700CA62|nr:hypothetical protein [Rhizobacter sp. Root404]KQW36735.1 hypothetical protein ASC76_19050 [Rhizobacter sp. Root404]